MNTLPFFPARRQRKLAGLFGLGLTIITPSHLAASAATPAEICQRETFFGATGCNVTTDAARIFWVPECGTIPNPLVGLARVPIPTPTTPVPGYIVSILYNRAPATRRLQLNGSSNNNVKEIFVGSPNSSDIINGGSGGDNAYMVGGGTSIVGADGTSVTPGGSTERDVLNLSPGAIDFVNIKPAGQSNPVTIVVPMRDSSGAIVSDPATRRPRGMSMPARGSGELTSSSAMDITSRTAACPSSTPPQAMGSAALTIAMAPAAGPRPLPLGATVNPAPVILSQEPPSPAAQDPITPSFPGVPAVTGFELNGSDALVLSLDDFPVDTNAYPNLSASQGLNPQTMGGPQACTAREGLGPVRRSKLLRIGDCQRKSPKTSAPESPLGYYSKTGLLVLSLNKDPLGSQSNPGFVIAQLLDRSGRPLKLNGSGNLRSFPTRFVIFTPPESKRTHKKPKPPSQDVLVR